LTWEEAEYLLKQKNELEEENRELKEIKPKLLA